MPKCAICGGGSAVVNYISDTRYEAEYIRCKRCGLNFCKEKHFEDHVCGVTRQPTTSIYSREGGFYGLAALSGIIMFILLILSGDKVYSVIPLGFLILFAILGIREHKLNPTFWSKNLPCPVCGKEEILIEERRVNEGQYHITAYCVVGCRKLYAANSNVYFEFDSIYDDFLNFSKGNISKLGWKDDSYIYVPKNST